MNNIDEFFGEGYELPTTQSKYSRIEKDKELRIRILSKPLIGFEYYDNKDKPHRQKEAFKELIDCKKNKFNGKMEQKEFWAFKVYNINTECVEIFQTDKFSIKGLIMDLIKDDDYGNPTQYDLKIRKEGDGTDTEYKVLPGKTEPLSVDVMEGIVNDTYVNLEALFSGKDPFDNGIVEELKGDVK